MVICTNSVAKKRENEINRSEKYLGFPLIWAKLKVNSQ